MKLIRKVMAPKCPKCRAYLKIFIRKPSKGRGRLYEECDQCGSKLEVNNVSTALGVMASFFAVVFLLIQALKFSENNFVLCFLYWSAYTSIFVSFYKFHFFIIRESISMDYEIVEGEEKFIFAYFFVFSIAVLFSVIFSFSLS